MQESLDRTPPGEVIPVMLPMPVLESSESDSVISATTPYALQDTASGQGIEEEEEEESNKEAEIALKALVERRRKEGFGAESFATPKRKATGSPDSEAEEMNPSNKRPSESKAPSFPIEKRVQEKRARHIPPAFRKRVSFTPGAPVQRRLDFLAVAEAEVEEFFGRAEANHPSILGFIDRFNFDVINDVPLPGRYEWVHVSE